MTALVTSRAAKGLFAKAWLASGSAIYPGQPLSEVEIKSLPYIKRIRACEDNLTAECLRNVDVEEIVSLIPQEWEPSRSGLPENSTFERHQWLVLDGNILQKHAFEVLTNNSLKMVIGKSMRYFQYKYHLLQH